MRLRLRSLEAAVRAVEDAASADQRMASILHRMWRNEASQDLTDDEEYQRMKLAREVHAGSPEAMPEVKKILREEAEHVEQRTADYLTGLPEGERGRWERLLRGGDVID